MLQVQQPSDQPRSDGRPSGPWQHWLRSDALDRRPVDHGGQHDERMMGIDVLQQRVALGLATLHSFTFLTHMKLA
jgi:hypothetical protein